MRTVKLLSNEYYVCKRGQEPIPWNPLDAEQTLDDGCVYFGKVFEAMEKSLELDNLVIYLTWDIYELPAYGQNVVAVVQGDEWCRIPAYFHKVRAVFKCYGTRPILGCNPFLKPSYLNFLTLMQFVKTWIARLPSSLNYVFYKFKSKLLGTRKIPPIYDIPLGYYKQLELPINNIEARLYDIFFAGSLAQKMYPVRSLKYWLGEPKSLSRKKMLLSINKLKEKRPDLKFEISLTPGFHATSSADAKSYSEKMMETKICLVPRGTSFETFRFFEALRYGCIVVTEALPTRWFYDGSPAIQITDWTDLGRTLDKLLENKQLMQEKHQESLNWWKTKCSEAVVGAYIAEKLNSLKSPS